MHEAIFFDMYKIPNKETPFKPLIRKQLNQYPACIFPILQTQKIIFTL